MINRILLLLSLQLFTCVSFASCGELFKTEMRQLHSNKQIDLCQVVGQGPVLAVNTASFCGFTPQFSALEALHQQYKDQGLVLLGFSSNDFYQEAEAEAQAAKVCRINYGVTFTMLATTTVTGEEANPVYQAINKQADEPSWNFTKYLIAPNGKVIARYDSSIKPNNVELINKIEQLLAI